MLGAFLSAFHPACATPLATMASAIVIDVAAKIEPAVLADLEARLKTTFRAPVHINPNFVIDLSELPQLGKDKYFMMELMVAYQRVRVPDPDTHYVLLIDGETFSPAKARNYSLSANSSAGSTGVISVGVLRLPTYVTSEFARRRFTERLYKSIKKRVITMFGYQPAVPDCLMRFFRSVAYIDQLPDDVCPSDRTVLETHGVLRRR